MERTYENAGYAGRTYSRLSLSTYGSKGVPVQIIVEMGGKGGEIALDAAQARDLAAQLLALADGVPLPPANITGHDFTK